MTQPDTLIDSYKAAQKLHEQQQDSIGPSALTRRRILAYAEQLANNKPSKDATILSQNTTDLIAKESIKTAAANDSQWKIRAFASVAVFGIAGLLMLQLSREAPDEFLPKAKPSASAERTTDSAANTVAESESKSSADKSAQATASVTEQASAAPVSAPTVLKPSSPAPSSLVPSPAIKSEQPREQPVKKSDAASRNDLKTALTKEQSESKAEAIADKAADVVQSVAPPAAAAAPSPVRSAAPASSALAPISAPDTMTDSAKLSRSTPAASRTTGNVTINMNARLFAAIQSKDAAALKLALEDGEDKNAKNAAGTPALSLSVQNGELNAVRLLIASGADVNALDAFGVSPLTHARRRGLSEIENLLLNTGAK
jgi:hypothetical protein